jgi:hypothetical protein
MLTTIAHLKEELNIPEIDLSQDDRLGRIINRATAWIERQTGRKLAKRTYDEEEGEEEEIEPPMTVELTNGKLYLPQYPVHSLTLDTVETLLEEGTDYTVDKEGGVITLLSTIKGPFTVTGEFGYDPIPDDLEQLCLEVAAKLYRQDGNVASESVGGWSRTFKDDPSIAEGLSLFTHWTL